MKIDAELTISRPRGANAECIAIRVTDATSGTRILELQIAPADFAEALVGLSNVKCDGHFYQDSPIGKTRENKTTRVKIPQKFRSIKVEERKAVAAKILKPFEVDGWIGNADDLFNHHRSSGEFQTVSFHRFVGGRGETVN